MIATIFSFSTGLVVMLVGAKIFLDVTKVISAKWRFSPLFISLIVVALGTNLPELTVTIAALSHSDPGLAMGNVVGSSIANLTIVLGTSTLFGKVRIGTTKTQKNAVLLLMITALFSILVLSSVTIIYQFLLLAIALIVTLIYQYIMAINGRENEDKKILMLISKLSRKKSKISNLIYLLLFISGLLGLSIGGNITVNSITKLSSILQISTTTLGLTLTAISTSLPEMLMSSIASSKKDNKVVLGTLIGSNIFNLSIFPAIILLATVNMKIKKIISIKEIFFLILVTLIFYVIVKKYKDNTIPKSVSVVLIALFAIFSILIFA